jgi:hypothetical protein
MPVLSVVHSVLGAAFRPMGDKTLNAVWGLCGENCPKSAKVWKISQNVENSDSMISVS